MTMDLTKESVMASVCKTPQLKVPSQSDQLIMAKTLLSDWTECWFTKPEDCSECETEWSEEEDGLTEMSPGSRELWESFLNTGDCYNTLNFSCSPEVKASDNDGYRETEETVQPFPLSLQVDDNTDCSEEEDSDWSEEDVSELSPDNRALWEAFLNNCDPYNPLHFSCSTEVKLKTSEIPHKRTLSRPTASTLHKQRGQSTKKSVKKVRFSEQVTVHTLEAWSAESRAARDGSCWMEMARDRARFRRRVKEAEQIISTCLTAQHRAKVIATLNHSDSSSLVTNHGNKLFFILAAIFLKMFLCSAVLFTSVH